MTFEELRDINIMALREFNKLSDYECLNESFWLIRSHRTHVNFQLRNCLITSQEFLDILTKCGYMLQDNSFQPTPRIM